ncbi:DinB family protein [Streptomyces sp. NPDC094448]|uniref:DinB family protein n=1 Tax=Streptomyces sp. NPDC094448 TaxID=3366063 RepID=UPI00382BB1C8
MTTDEPAAASARAALLAGQLDLVWALFEYHLPDLDFDDHLWEPAPGAWTVRPDGAGRWVPDWQVPEPDPVPTTSIGWLSWHIGYWWTVTLRHCFGDGAPAREEIFWPGGAGAAADWLRGLKDEWRAELVRLTDEDLDSTGRTAGLPLFGDTVLTLAETASWVNFELAKNVSEIGLTVRLRRTSA